AGIGVADLVRDIMVKQGLGPEEASTRFWGLGSRGLVHSGGPMRPFQERYSRAEQELSGWEVDERGRYALLDVVRNVRPTILIGTSAQPGSFTERVVREMAAHCERPVIMPLSNPTSKAEAHPADLLAWTEGRAL